MVITITSAVIPMPVDITAGISSPANIFFLINSPAPKAASIIKKTTPNEISESNTTVKNAPAGAGGNLSGVK